MFVAHSELPTDQLEMCWNGNFLLYFTCFILTCVSKPVFTCINYITNNMYSRYSSSIKLLMSALSCTFSLCKSVASRFLAVLDIPRASSVNSIWNGNKIQSLAELATQQDCHMSRKTLSCLEYTIIFLIEIFSHAHTHVRFGAELQLHP